jgi:hypothetical protein
MLLARASIARVAEGVRSWVRSAVSRGIKCFPWFWFLVEPSNVTKLGEKVEGKIGGKGFRG